MSTYSENYSGFWEHAGVAGTEIALTGNLGLRDTPKGAIEDSGGLTMYSITRPGNYSYRQSKVSLKRCLFSKKLVYSLVAETPHKWL